MATLHFITATINIEIRDQGIGGRQPYETDFGFCMSVHTPADNDNIIEYLHKCVDEFLIKNKGTMYRMMRLTNVYSPGMISHRLVKVVSIQKL